MSECWLCPGCYLCWGLIFLPAKDGSNKAKINILNTWYVEKNVWIAKINKSEHSDILQKTLTRLKEGILKRIKGNEEPGWKMERKVRGRKAAVNYLNQTTSCANRMEKAFWKGCMLLPTAIFTDDVNRRIRRILNNRSILLHSYSAKYCKEDRVVTHLQISRTNRREKRKRRRRRME